MDSIADEKEKLAAYNRRQTYAAEYNRRQNWLKVRLLNDEEENQLVELQRAFGKLRGLDGPASRTCVCRWALDMAAKQLLKPTKQKK